MVLGLDDAEMLGEGVGVTLGVTEGLEDIDAVGVEDMLGEELGEEVGDTLGVTEGVGLGLAWSSYAHSCVVPLALRAEKYSSCLPSPEGSYGVK